MNALARSHCDLLHAWAELTHVRMHYVSAGAGSPVVLLHGWPQTWHEWRHVIPGLATNFRVIAPDMRGLGDTSDPGDDYRKSAVAGDVIELIERLLPGQPAHVVGHDWGGPVGFAIALTRPDLVASLAIVDVPLPGDGRKEGLAQGGKRWHHLFHRTPDLPEILTQGRERAYLGWFLREYSESEGAVCDADLDEYVRCYARPGAMRAGFEYYRAAPLDAQENAALLGRGKLQMPVLTVAGGAGRGRGPECEDSVRRCAENVTSVVLEGCGHLVPEERPLELTELILAHVDDDRRVAPID